MIAVLTARCGCGVLALAGLCVTSLLHAQAPPLQIVTDQLPPASAGVPYSQPLTTAGGLCSAIGDASSRIDSGALPPGINVVSPPSLKQWSLQGTPTTAGTFTFTLHLIWTHSRVSPFDHDCTDEATKVLTIAVQSNQTLSVDRTQIFTTYQTGQFPPLPDTVLVSSTAGTATIGVQAATDTGGPWLSAAAQRTTTPTSISISYNNVTALAPGTYNGRVTITSGTGASVSIPVTLQVVSPSNIQLLATPASLTFTSIIGGVDPLPQTIHISVNGVGSSSIFIFQAIVSAAPPNGKWFSVSPLGAATPADLTVRATAKDLPVGQYNGTLIVAISGVSGGQLSIPITFNVQQPPQTVKPTVLSSGIVNAAGLGGAIAPGTWVSLFGSSLSTTTRTWRDTDFISGRLPTTLDGVSVTINGKAAAVAFVSPLQINVLAPDDTATGLVPVQVKNSLGTSDTPLVLLQTAAPAFFQFPTPAANYVAGTHANGTYLAGPPLNRLGTSGTPAKPGETIVLYGTGFGATQPVISATALVPSPLPLARPEDLRVRIGGLDAQIAFAGLVSPGLYQFNVVVPQLADGDQPVVAELRGLLSQANLLLTIQK